MKLCKLIIRDFQQFKNLELNFTHPETGEPLEKICLIGSNGTGKSTVIKLLHGFISHSINVFFTESNRKSYLLLQVKLPSGKKVFILHSKYYQGFGGNEHAIFNEAFEKTEKEFYDETIFDNNIIRYPLEKFSQYRITDKELENIRLEYSPENSSINLFIPPENFQNNTSPMFNVPNTSLDEALRRGSDLFKKDISDENINDFWARLIYHIKYREKEREEFETKPENLNKTKRELINEFDEENPKILDRIAKIWNLILAKADLEFDIENAKIPTSLNENLYVYIRLKSNKENIPYHQLSTGIRNFIFRVGHIYSLYFNREIKRGFLLVDEPENSLFPDFLLDLINIYKEATTDKNGEHNTQMFFATHNPIIAAQFEPYERIILEWTEEGNVVARRGTAPLGDDPNDLLVKDFEISSLMPKAGVEVWEKYIGLKKRLRRTSDEEEKKKLISEISQIGYEYNFEE